MNESPRSQTLLPRPMSWPASALTHLPEPLVVSPRLRLCCRTLVSHIYARTKECRETHLAVEIFHCLPPHENAMVGGELQG